MIRALQGVDPAHPFIEELKRKNLFTLTEFGETDAVAPDWLDRYTAACKRAAPLVEVLTKALSLRW